MIEKLLQYKNGYVKIRLISPKPERVLNLCSRQGILLSQIRQAGETWEMQISLKDFFRLKPVCKKTHSRIHVVKRWGLPFFFYRNKKRKAFFIGIFLCFALVIFLSQFVWRIQVEGNYYNTTQEILKFLEEKDVRHGIPKKEINCALISAMIREQFPDITWVSARLSGTNLSITIQENENPASFDSGQEEAPSSIVSNLEGTIVKMITRQGAPQVQAGDFCEKGDLLVLGRLDIKNDSQEVIRYDYVTSDADIYIRHTCSYYDSFPLSYEKKSFTGNEKSRPFFQIFSLRAEGGSRKKQYEKEDTVTQTRNLYLTENFVLPFSYGTIVQKEYVMEKVTYTEEEARKKAQENIQFYLEKLLDKGVEICQNNIEIQTDGSFCTAKGTLQVIEKAGYSVPVEKMEIPDT